MPINPLLYLQDAPRHIAWKDAEPDEKFEATGYFQCPIFDKTDIEGEILET